MSIPYEELRCSAQERQRVVERLQRALTAGQLTPEEFEDRHTLAVAARTVGDLAQLTRDLPGSLW